MFEFLLFIAVAAVGFLIFIRRAKAMAPMMNELATRGIDIEAQVVKKYRVHINSALGSHKYIVYSFTLGNGQTFSKKISPSFEQWESLEEGDTLPVVYLAEDPESSTTKDMADQIRAAMPQKAADESVAGGR